MKDMNQEVANEPCCSDSLVDDLIRSAKRNGKSSASIPTGYPGRYTRGLDPKYYATQQRWNGLIDELVAKGYRISCSYIESFVQESGGNTHYFAILTISWENNC